MTCNVLFMIQIIERTQTWSIVYPGINFSNSSPINPPDPPFSLISPDTDGKLIAP